MSGPEESEEVLRVPGSPQREVRKVRGSWRDYLDPGVMLSEEEDEDGCVVSAEADFEPFSDTCGEGDESDLEGLDLTLFEPAGSPASGCPHCCREVARRHGALPGTLYILTTIPPNGKHLHLS